MNQRAVIGRDGVSRRLFTASDVMRMVEVGLIDEDERLELVEGELHAMSPAGVPHEKIKQHLNMLFGRQRPDRLHFASECTWEVDPLTVLVPDFVFHPADRELAGLAGADVLLVIEVADTSLDRDLGLKAELYAGMGVPEYWVIDIASRVVHVHRDPKASRYVDVMTHDAEAVVIARFATGITLRLGDLPVR